MAAKKKQPKKKASWRKAKNPTKAQGAKLWKAPKSNFWGLLTLPFRLIYNSTYNLRFVVRWPVRAALTGAFFMAVLVVLFCLIYVSRAKLFYDMDHVARMPARTMVYANDGQTELGRLHGDNRYIVKYDDVSENFIQALLAQEDEHFISHNGVDIIGLFKIPYHYIKNNKVLGASTITMQLARNAYKSIKEGPGVDRKLMEIALAYRIESNYEKKRS